MYYCFESHIIFYTISCGFLIDITHQHVKDWLSEINFFLGYVESKSRYFFQKQKRKLFLMKNMVGFILQKTNSKWIQYIELALM